MLPLKYVDDPRTACIMFRKTSPQLTGQGGLIDTARDIYGQLPKRRQPKYKVQDKEFKFPNGATVRYRPMEHEKDKYDYQGLQFTFIGFDEATQFTWSQIEYLMSRMRSASKYQSRMVMSCNPDPDHELRKMIDWYLDSDGYPIPERDGVIRWFLQLDDEFYWSDSKEDLIEKYECDPADPVSFSFISATIYDNPPMLNNNPKYLSKLKALNEVDKAQLLYG